MTKRRKSPIKRATEKQKQDDLLSLAACMIALSLEGRNIGEFIPLVDIKAAGEKTHLLAGEWDRDEKGNQRFRFLLKEEGK